MKLAHVKDINISISREFHIQAAFYWVSEEEISTKALQRKGLLKDNLGEIPLFMYRNSHIWYVTDNTDLLVKS